MTVADAADLVMEIVERGGARAIYHAMDEGDVERIMQHPATAIGSDGGVSVFGASVPHPREYGAFVRVLGRYVRERGVLTLEEAVRKMSGATAQRLGLQDRGLLREGFFADIAVFDPDRVIDRRPSSSRTSTPGASSTCSSTAPWSWTAASTRARGRGGCSLGPAPGSPPAADPGRRALTAPTPVADTRHRVAPGTCRSATGRSRAPRAAA